MARKKNSIVQIILAVVLIIGIVGLKLYRRISINSENEAQKAEMAEAINKKMEEDRQNRVEEEMEKERAKRDSILQAQRAELEAKKAETQRLIRELDNSMND